MFIRLFILLVIAIRCAAYNPGDLVSASIETNGWNILLTFANMSTNGSYSMGIGSTNTLSSPKVRLDMTDTGYDTACNSTSYTRSVYATKQVRLPYPSNTSTDPNANTNYDQSVVSVTNITLRFALSDFIADKTSNITATIASGLYIQGGVTSGAASAFTVSNGSTEPYQQTVANWTWPEKQHVNNNTLTLRAAAFNRFARQGKPVAAIRFTVQDSSGTKLTNVVTSMTIDRTIASTNQVQVPDYVSSFDVSSLTTPGVLTCNLEAYPWIGNNPTLSASYSANEFNPSIRPTTNWLDRSNTYGITVAVVATNGNDTTGKAWDISQSTNATSSPFATIGRACNAIVGTNNSQHSRGDAGAGQIWLRGGGTYAWSGASTTFGTTPQTYCTVMTHTNDVNRSAIISGVGGNQSIANRVRFKGVTLLCLGTFYNTANSEGDIIWIDDCSVNDTGASAMWQETHASASEIIYLTRSIVTNVAQGLKAFSTQKNCFSLVRGNELYGFNGQIVPYTMIGNTHWGGAVGSSVSSSASSGMPNPGTNMIVGWNAYYRCNSSATHVFQINNLNAFGLAFVNNLIEVTNSGGSSAVAIASDGNTVQIDNVLLWHNTVTGQRGNIGYNDSGSTFARKHGWSFVGNVLDDNNIKSDTFGTPNANRTGNWPCLYGVGYRANIHGEINGIGAGGFLNEFVGLYSTWVQAQTNTSIVYVNRQSYDGITGGAGLGDYRHKAKSPTVVIGYLSRSTVLPFDLYGVSRGAVDPVGAFCTGSPYRQF